MELSPIGINHEIALFYRYLTQPWSGCLDQAFHVFLYLKSRGRNNTVLYPHINDFDSEFVYHDWQDFYGKIEEKVPDNAPEARRGSVSMTQSVDTVTR